MSNRSQEFLPQRASLLVGYLSSLRKGAFAVGYVARNINKRNAGSANSHLPHQLSLEGHSTQTSQKCRSLHAVSFFSATYLTFPEHMYRFLSLQRSPRGLKGKEAHPELDEPFDEAIILLDEVVEIWTLPQFASLWHQPLRFELPERFWRGRVFSNGDAKHRSMRGKPSAPLAFSTRTQYTFPCTLIHDHLSEKASDHLPQMCMDLP